jgi:hypothetical protein
MSWISSGIFLNLEIVAFTQRTTNNGHGLIATNCYREDLYPVVDIIPIGRGLGLFEYENPFRLQTTLEFN